MENLKPVQQLGHKIFKVMVCSIKGYHRDQCWLSASALTLYTLFSIVPLAAMTFGIAKGFGFQAFLESKVMDYFEGREEIISFILGLSTNLLEKTKGGLMAIIGVILLVYALIKLMGHIESVFNRIWAIETGRPLVRKVADYITISLGAGLLVIFSGSATIFITTHLAKFLMSLNLPQSLDSLISFGFNIFPFVSVWLLFVFFYLLMPNKKIDPGEAIAGGIIAGTLFQILQIIYLKFQVVVSSHNAVYGSFAAVPLFLAWVQVSWSILLYGAQISVAWKNEKQKSYNSPAYDRISMRVKKLILLKITLVCVKEFAANQGPVTDSQISDRLGLPFDLVGKMLASLMDAHLIYRVVLPEKAGEFGYSPARNIENLTITDAVDAIETQGENILTGTMETKVLEESLAGCAAAGKFSSRNHRLKDI